MIRMLTMALTLWLSAGSILQAGVVDEAKGLMGQGKFVEAFALLEKDVARRDADAPTLETGMDAALGAGRIVAASRLAQRLVKTTGGKDARVLYRCGEIAVLAGQDDQALARWRAFAEQSSGDSPNMRRALDYVLRRGNFPDAYAKALAIYGPQHPGLWEQGERMLGQLLAGEEYDKALALGELLFQRYGKQPARANRVAQLLSAKRSAFASPAERKRILTLLAGGAVTDESTLRTLYHEFSGSLPLAERLTLLFGIHGNQRAMSDWPLFEKFGEMRLLESIGERATFGGKFLALEPVYLKPEHKQLYAVYLRLIVDYPQVFKIEGRELVSAGRVRRMFDNYAQRSAGELNQHILATLAGSYFGKDPKAEEALLRQHLKRLPLERFRRLVQLTEGRELDAQLAQYSGGVFGKATQAHIALLETYNRLQRKVLLPGAARLAMLTEPMTFNDGQILNHFCRSELGTIPAKSKALLEVLTKCGVTPPLERLAKSLAGDKEWKADPGFQQLQRGITAKQKGNDPLLSAYVQLLGMERRQNKRNQPVEKLGAAFVAAYKGQLPGDVSRAANEQELLAYRMCEAHGSYVWDNRPAIYAWGEMWGPKFREPGPLWERLTRRVLDHGGAGRDGALWRLAPTLAVMMARGGEPSEQTLIAFSQNIHPEKDSSTPFEKYYGRMGPYAWNYVMNQRDSWPLQIFYAQFEKVFDAGVSERSARDILTAKQSLTEAAQRAKSDAPPPKGLSRKLYDRYLEHEQREGVYNAWGELELCEYYAASLADNQEEKNRFLDQHVKRLAARERVEQLNALTVLLARGALVDDKSRERLLTTTYQSLLNGVQPNEWPRVQLDPEIFSRLTALAKTNEAAERMTKQLLSGLVAGAQPTREHQRFLQPLRETLLKPALANGQWQTALGILDVYSRLALNERAWAHVKRNYLDPVIELLAEAQQPELAYVFASTIIDRVEYSRELAVKEMLGVRARAAKDIPGLVPVEKGHPAFELYLAARALTERNEELAWKLTQPRLNVLRQEWPALDISYVAWAVEQMRKQRMLKEARDFCFEILLKEYDLPPEAAAAIMLTKGDTYRAMENFQAARIEYQSLRDNKRYKTTPAGNLARYRLIEIMITTGEFGTAEAQLERLVDAGTAAEQAEAYYLYARIAFEQQDYVQSRDYLKETFQRVHGHVEGRLLEGELKLKLPRGLASTEVLLGRVDLQTVAVPGRELTLKLRDTNLSIAQGGQSVPVIVSTSVGGDSERVRLVVSPDDSTLFIGTIQSALGKATPGNMRMEICGRDEVSYIIDPEYQKANEIDYPAKLLEVRADARLVASSGEFLTPEEEERRRMEIEVLRRQGALSARFLMQRGTVVRPGSPVYVQLTDFDRDMTDQPDRVSVDIRTSSGDLLEGFALSETEPHSGVFEGAVPTGIPFPLVTASDAEEGTDPNAAINSTKSGGWVSVPDGKMPKWLEVDTMSSHDVKSVRIKTPDANRVKRMRVIGTLDVNTINLGYYQHDGKQPGLDGLSLQLNGHHAEEGPESLRAVFRRDGDVQRVEQPIYKKAETKHKQGDRWLNARLSGTFWLDEDRRMTFKFLQPESPNNWQTAFLYIDGKRALGGRMDRGALEQSKSLFLDRGPHVLEALVRDHWKNASAIVGLQQRDGTFAPMPAELFSTADNPGLADFLRPRGAVTKTADGFAIELEQSERIRRIRCLFEDFSGDGLAVGEIAVTDAEGKAVLPVPQDFETGLKNRTLEIAAGDAIEVTYLDEKRLSEKNPKLTARLSARFYNGQVSLLFEEAYADRDGRQFLRHPEAQRVRPGDQLVVSVTDYDLDLTDKRDRVPIVVTTSSGERLELEALEGNLRDPDQPGRHTGTFGQILRVGKVTEKNTIKVVAGDQLRVAYLDQENTSPGIPITREDSVDVAPDDQPTIAVFPTHLEQVEDESGAANAERLRLQKLGRKDAKVMKDQVVAAEPGAPDAPVRVSVQAPLLFSVRYRKMALHRLSVCYVHAVAASELAAAGREAREPVTLKAPLQLVAPEELARGKGYAVEFPKSSAEREPLADGTFIGIIRMQIGSPGDEADTLIRISRPFRLEEELTDRIGRDDSLLSHSRIGTMVVAGADTVHLSVRDEQGAELAKAEVRLMSDARLQLMDRSYSIENTAVHLGQRFYAQLIDPDQDTSDQQDKIAVAVKGTRDVVKLELVETLPHSGVFTASLTPRFAAAQPTSGSLVEGAQLDVELGDEVEFTYTDTKPLRSNEPVKHVVKGRIHKGGDADLVGFSKQFKDPDMAVKTRFLMAEAMFEMAKHHRKLGSKDAAAAEIARGKRILEEAMRDYPDTKHVVQGEYLLANLAQELGNFTEAVGRYSSIIGNWPDSEYAIKAQLKKAICYERMSQHDQAAEEYVRLTYMYPESSLVADATVRLANQYYKTRQYTVAGRIFEQFQTNHPEHQLAAKSLFLAGQCYMKQEEFGKSAKTFKGLVEQYPDQKDIRPEAMYWMADSWYQGGEYVDAYRWFKRLTWDYPETKWAKIARGRLTEELMQSFESLDVDFN
ncbi:tetratricopeptide repeat protein [Candidatus Sumerlaeota bacterium]